jgi:hypothetical protein
VNAATGKLCWAIRTGAVFGRIEEEQLSRLACDDARVYLARPSGLRAFSTQPVDPKRPDPTDPWVKGTGKQRPAAPRAGSAKDIAMGRVCPATTTILPQKKLSEIACISGGG